MTLGRSGTVDHLFAGLDLERYIVNRLLGPKRKRHQNFKQVVRFVYAYGDSYFFDGLRKDLSQWKDPGGMLNNNPDASIPEGGQHLDDQSKCKSIVFHNRMEVSHVFPPPTTRRIPIHGKTNFMLQQGCHLLELTCSSLMILILRIESAAVSAHWIIQNATNILGQQPCC
ncbi:conserved hypothetical protein [Histoplasma capsulatum var. duboisii H88]|uniref:Uncharacterized protein n=1 Tax=Ajellomyces capsulatus (strain H88) TaxID=544711 RepID=F0UTX4_AJEC8|nr:conserved hypothetical protein [Histoplasma capsulatum var. duboisii H88]